MGVASIRYCTKTHREADFDFVAATVSAPELQLQRIMDRDGCRRGCSTSGRGADAGGAEGTAGDFVILTGGTQLATDRQVDELLVAIQHIAQ
jgi:dephospho-CoA kinase